MIFVFCKIILLALLTWFTKEFRRILQTEELYPLIAPVIGYLTGTVWNIEASSQKGTRVQDRTT